MRSHNPWSNVSISGLSLPMRHSYENEWVFYYHINTNKSAYGERLGIRKVNVRGKMSYTDAVKHFTAALRARHLFDANVDAVVTTQFDKADYSDSDKFDRELKVIR